MKEYGHFEQDGKTYSITTVNTPTVWKNFLFNDEYFTEIDQQLQGKSSIVTGYVQKKISTGRRIFLIKDENGELYAPNADDGALLCRPYENLLRCEHDGIKTEALFFVPNEGTYEIFSIRVANTEYRTRRIKLYCGTEVTDESPMGAVCQREGERIIYKRSFPYHVYYEEKESAEKKHSYFSLISDTVPDSCEMSRRRFASTVNDERLSGIPAEAEDCIEVMQFDIELKPGEEREISFLFGGFITLDAVKKIKDAFNWEFVARTHKALTEKWNGIFDKFTVSTPNKEFDALINYWLKKQSMLLARLNRMGTYCPIRNRLQDTMGYGFTEPEEAAGMMLKLIARQQHSGFLQQWYMTDGSKPVKLCLVNHSDAPLWLIIAVTRLVGSLGDVSYFSKTVEYIDGGEDSVYMHLVNAAYYMYSQTGRHGMCLMKDGDWTDPINGAGRLGRGESTWNTFALIYSTKELLKLAEYFGDNENYRLLSERMEEMTGAVNRHAWFEDRYCAGFDDDGKPYGTPETDGRIFLNAQTWALIAGCTDEERVEKLMETISKTETPFGPVLLSPPFEEWDPVWGRLSIKKAGTTENGSVYNHASMFKAFSDSVRCDADALYRTMIQTLPINPDNPVEKSLQMPTYISNYYYALEGSANYGRSSCNFETGTTAWMQYLVQEKLMGLESSCEGIRLKPLLPRAWKEIKCRLKYRSAEYKVYIHRNGKDRMYIDGRETQERLLPYEDGRTYEIDLEIGG